ncbi:hypothetical protein HYFRA_00009452 [Hymenoscyphus fraxineus]|uniref:Nudix hydrolase domain-containing protein n=1 Tax=Hymenoscyphus fraxineus TaxID=746836 RepID=A0A9N9KZD2_9HELO|nr:hypothetical protein HYFRA_00009452 [Hymenoscyphus fraxineus]
MRRLPVNLISRLRIHQARLIHKKMSSNLRQRAVVSSFICTPPQTPTGLTFALFKRSEEIRTYPGKWAVCSGSIDATDTSPENAAKREILEETSLSDEDIFLLRRGKPFSLIDENLKTQWTIHPFAWQLKPHSKPIKLDWEHTEYQFIKPEELAKLDHVPQLEIGLRRVLVSPDLERSLSVLKNDHESGAQALAIKALELLVENVNGDELSNITSPLEFWKEIRWRAWHLAKNGRPSMGAAIEASMFRSLDAVRKKLDDPGLRLKDGSESDLRNLKKILETTLSERISTLQHTLSNLSDSFEKFIEKDQEDYEGGAPKTTNIVTLSASGTITAALSKLIRTHTKSGREIKLTILESRPKFEGVRVVNTLIKSFDSDPEIMKNFKVDIVSDASIATALEGAHFLLLGADKVLPDGSVSNKIGSLTAAIVAKKNPESKCKVLALYQSDKITDSSFEGGHLKIESNDPSELMESWPSKCTEDIVGAQKAGWQVGAKNRYFEWVPKALVDAHITERGLLSQDDIGRIGNEARVLEEELFQDLSS